MLRIAVIDDEKSSLTLLSGYLTRFLNGKGIHHKLNTYTSGFQFLESYHGDFDIIFLDIEMPDMNGMQTAKELRRIDEDVCLIFVTNMARYAIRGYEVNALDFVVKPVGYEIFSHTVNKALRFLSKYKREKSVHIQYDGMIRKIALAEIYYVEVTGSYLIYHTIDGDYSTRGPLKNVEQELADEGFLRCNHSYLVNLNHVTNVRNDSVFVGTAELKISRHKKKEFLNGLGEYLGGKI